MMSKAQKYAIDINIFFRSQIGLVLSSNDYLHLKHILPNFLHPKLLTDILSENILLKD